MLSLWRNSFLLFFEVDGATEGEDCDVHNKCLCPYGAKSWELIKVGNIVKYLWRLVEFYDVHWNGPQCDGRMDSIADGFKKYKKTG